MMDIGSWAQKHPHKIACSMADGSQKLTFQQLNEQVGKGAQFFEDEGLAPGDHVGLLLDNQLAYFSVCFAAERAGLYYTPINIRLSCDDIAFIIQHSEIKILVTEQRFVQQWPELFTKLQQHMAIFYVDGVGTDNWFQTIQGHHVKDTATGSLGQDMIYSSGTTGTPKAIKWPLVELPSNGRTMLVDLLSGLFGYDDNTNYLSTAPLYHAAPLRHSMTVMKVGGCVYVMEKFDALESLKAIEALSITHSQWVPAMFVRLLKLPLSTRTQFDLSSHQMAVHAAAPCPIDIKQMMMDWWGPIIHEYYAGTENNGFCAITPTQWMSHRGSVGRSKHGVIHICDDEGSPLPIGQIGHVYFSGGQPFAYHKDPERTAKTQNELGWTTIGDIGKIDEEGYLYLQDRVDFLINSGGVKIYPQKIEDAIVTQENVMDVAVFGWPDDDFGEVVTAIIQPLEAVEDEKRFADDIKRELSSKLGKFEIPKHIGFLEQLPRHPTGKLYKKKLREDLLASVQKINFW